MRFHGADASSGNSPSWRPELAIVEYSPKPLNSSPESRAEGEYAILKSGKKKLNF